MSTFLAGVGIGLLVAQTACSLVEDREALRWAGVVVLFVAVVVAAMTNTRLP